MHRTLRSLETYGLNPVRWRYGRLAFVVALASGVGSCRTFLEDNSVASVTVAPAEVAIEPADTAALRATAFGQDGEALQVAAIRWTSTDTAIVNVSASGVIRALRNGSATITASAGRKYASTVVTSSYPRLAPVREYAHRGFASTFPENTLIAVAGAFDRGADGVEVDVQLSADGVPVIMHDPTVDRTTDGKGRVDALKFEELRALDACARRGTQWGRCQIPTPAEVLAAVHGRGVVILDLKGSWPSSDLRALLRIVSDAGLRDSVMMTSFSIDLLELVRRLDPRVVLGYLQSEPQDTDRLLNLGYAVSLVDEASIRRNAASMPAYAAQLEARRSLLGAFTLLSGNDLPALRAGGARWFISDVPLDRAQLALSARLTQ